MPWHKIQNMNKKLKRITHFFLASFGGFLISLAILYSLTEFFQIHYLFSALIAFVFSSLYSFGFNRKITFRGTTSRVHVQGFKFLLTNLITLVISMLFLYSLTEFANIYYLFSQLLASIVTFSINFFIAKNWAFT
jgi:putative flippase GtrA